MNRVVIVGAGAAGNAAAEELRTQGFNGSISLLSADTVTPYDRPNLSKDYLAGRAPEEWIPLRNEEFYREAGIDIRFGVRAVSLDATKKIITTSSGETFEFDRCLLATGATPRRLSVSGSQLPHVHYLRTLEDCRRIISAAGQAKNAVVIGSGFIGLEVAASLRARGMKVSVVSMDAIPLQRVVGKEIGSFLQKTHEANGVTFYLKRNIDQITAQSVKLDQGELVPADLVVVGIGVSPDIGLAESAGLRLGGGGVEVDTYLETSASGVFAAGDLAFFPDARTGERMRIEHWAVAGRQGQAAARNLLGQRAPYRTVPFFWTAQYDTTLAYVGHAPAWDEIRVSGKVQNNDATVAFLSQGVVRAVATLGRDTASLEAEAALESGDNARLLALLKE
nr:FAD-dependent oxidoreductase [Oligoflexus tunisiensis]